MATRQCWPPANVGHPQMSYLSTIYLNSELIVKSFPITFWQQQAPAVPVLLASQWRLVKQERAAVCFRRLYPVHCCLVCHQVTLHVNCWVFFFSTCMWYGNAWHWASMMQSWCSKDAILSGSVMHPGPAAALAKQTLAVTHPLLSNSSIPPPPATRTCLCLFCLFFWQMDGHDWGLHVFMECGVYDSITTQLSRGTRNHNICISYCFTSARVFTYQS